MRLVGVIRCTSRGVTKSMSIEDNIDEPGDLVPRESDEIICIHLQANDSFICRSDPVVPNNVVFRLRDSH
jgi:hypothetical protein